MTYVGTKILRYPCFGRSPLYLSVEIPQVRCAFRTDTPHLASECKGEPRNKPTYMIHKVFQCWVKLHESADDVLTRKNKERNLARRARNNHDSTTQTWEFLFFLNRSYFMILSYFMTRVWVPTYNFLISGSPSNLKI